MSSGGGVTVGVDIGTTSVKAVAVDASGTILERVRLPHPLLSDRPGRFEHDVERAWRRAPRTAVRRLAHHQPAAVAVTTMVPSMAPLTARGRPLGPGLLYGDERGGGAEESVGFLRWLAASYPEAAHCWPASAVANHALGGRGVADIATCFTMGALLGAGGWSEEVCRSVGSSTAVLPELGGSGDPIGTVTGTDIVLATGSVDGWCEQLVGGATEPGDVLILCGTTLLIWQVTAEPVEVAGLWTHPNPSGRWVVGGASNAGGLLQDWLGRLTGKQPEGRGSQKPQPAPSGSTSAPQPAGRGSREPQPAPSGSLGLCRPHDVPVVVPYVRGERTPFHDPARRASVHGLHLGHTAAHLQRAGWEASAFVARHHLELIDRPIGRVVVAGGGSQVDGWVQALADGLGRPVHVAADPEGAAKGAAWLAHMSVGGDDGAGTAGAAAWARTGRIVDPDPAWVAPTAERYDRFRTEGDRST